MQQHKLQERGIARREAWVEDDKRPNVLKLSRNLHAGVSACTPSTTVMNTVVQMLQHTANSFEVHQQGRLAANVKNQPVQPRICFSRLLSGYRGRPVHSHFWRSSRDHDLASSSLRNS